MEQLGVDASEVTIQASFVNDLGADSLATWLEAQGYQVQRLKSKKGYRVTSVSTGAGSSKSA